MAEWLWLGAEEVIAAHDEQLREFGGAEGIRDAGLLSSALARSQNLAAYGQPSLFELAAAYTVGIVQNHPFVDGNKRTGFLAACVFLDLNGWEFNATEEAAVITLLDLAEHEIDASQFAAWLQENSVKRGLKR